MPNESTRPDLPESLKRRKNYFIAKNLLINSLRKFFAGKKALEVFTPVKIKAPAPEEYIEAVPCGSEYLRSSPELEMKSMLAAGFERIFQIGPCFRAGEYGTLHREEFLMLEYYFAGMDYRQLMWLTVEMIRKAATALSVEKTVFHGNKIDFFSEWEVLTVDEAFRALAGISVFDAIKKDIFEETLVGKVEPGLNRDVPVFLIDYPAEMASLARLKKSDGRFAERWELYIGGIEIANAFGELTEPVEQKKRFTESAAFREKHGMRNYPIPEDFYKALDMGIPEASGCALGVERLLMTFTGAEDIGRVLFP
jgi:lysyl-tRNA synthetase class 2